MAMLRLCVAQTNVLAGDREGNFENLEKILSAFWIASETETVILLPELWDVGYVIDAPGFYGDPEALLAAEFLGGLAKKFGCWFAGGSVLTTTDEGVFNRAMVVNPQGKYVAHYDKVHLIARADEDKYLKAGDKILTSDIGGVKTGFSVCYDLRFPEWQRLYALEGAELLMLSAQWPVRRIDHWDIMLRSCAVENMMFTAACNRVGTSQNITYGGHSLVVDPWGKVLYEGSAEREEIAFVDIDRTEAGRARNFLNALKGRRPRLYEKICE